MQNKIISVVVFFIVLSITYYWMIVDESRQSTMNDLNQNDVELSGDVNSTLIPESLGTLIMNRS